MLRRNERDTCGQRSSSLEMSKVGSFWSRFTKLLKAPERDHLIQPEKQNNRSLEIHTAGMTNAGSVRDVNEDAVSIVHPTSPDALKQRGVLAIVADGMGGAQGGQCASSTAVDVISRLYYSNQDPPPLALQRALNEANSIIYKMSKRDPKLEGMGTTCVALALTPAEAWVAWVGDSRLYLVRDGQIFQLTEDHSVVAALVRDGLITSQEAALHQERHVLTRALGTKPEGNVSVWDHSMPVRPGDRFLLCTDGLHDLLSDEDLLNLAATGPLEQASAALIEKANHQGGYDNISSVLLEVCVAQVVSTVSATGMLG